MQTQEIFNGIVNKEFVVINADPSNYSVGIVKATNDELKSDGLGRYGYDNDKYPLLTASQYVGERDFTELEVGDTIELDTYVTAIRVA